MMNTTPAAFSAQPSRRRTPFSQGWRALAATLMAGAMASSAFGQGAYYPVNPAGAPYGATYTGTPVLADPDLAFLQQVMQTVMPGADPTLTLQVPIPTGYHAPSSAEMALASNYAIRAVVNGSAPVGVTYNSLVSDAINVRPLDRTAVISAMSQGVLDSGVAAAAQVTAFNNLVQALSVAQPTNISTNIPLVLAKVVTGTDPLLPQSVTQLVATAINQIPNDASQIQNLIASGLSNLSVSTLSAANRKTVILSSYIPTLLASNAALDNPTIIDTMMRSLTNATALSMVTPSGPLTALDQVLQTAIASIPSLDKNEAGAVATGALRTLGLGYASQIQTRLNTELAGNPSAQAFTNNVVSGFTASSATYNGLVTGNSNADAVAAGAIARGAAVVPTAQVIQQALLLGTALPQSVIFSATSANSDLAVTIVQAAVQGSGGGYQPYGTATFNDLVSGAVRAVPRNDQVGAIVSGLIQKTAGTLTTLPGAAVNTIVTGAITAAYQTGKDGAFFDIVGKAAGLAGSTSGISAPMVTAAINQINTVTTGDIRYPTPQDRPTYVAVVAALASDLNLTNRNAIRTATLGGGGSLAAVGGDVTAAQLGSDMVEAVRANAATKYTAFLKQFDNERLSTSPTNATLAGLYAAAYTGSDHLSAALAAAIKQSSVSPAALLEVANNASNNGSTALLSLVADVASHAKTSPNDLLNYLGSKIVTNPSSTKDIAAAWTVVDPNHAHFVSHAVAFNNPTGAAAAVAGIFTYTQITNTQPFAQNGTGGNPTGATTAIVDQPAAAAAIVAGFTTGILEANISQTDRKSSLVAMVAAAVTASIGQNGVYLQGPANPFNNPGDTALNFRQSNGSQWNGVTPLKTTGAYGGTVRTVGAAGAITGYMAQVVHLGDVSLWQVGETQVGVPQTDSITAAVLRSAAINGSGVLLEIAQAAGQAFGWVSGTNTGAAADAIALQIAQAMIPSGTLGGKTQTDLLNAARFGLAESAAGRIGAGALGLGSNAPTDVFGKPIVAASGNSNANFYRHRSATGAPVTDIFNL